MAPRRETSQIYFHAMSGELAIGFVKNGCLRVVAPAGISDGGHECECVPNRVKKHGQSDNMESAQVEVLKNWQLWLDLAELRPR
jgi:hypothetical protein